MDKKNKEELRKRCSEKLKEIEELKKKIEDTKMTPEIMLKLKKVYGVTE